MIDMTPALTWYAQRRIRRIRSIRPSEAQINTLLKLLLWSGNTDFGRAHDFRSIRTVKDFQRAVPVATYEDYWRDWWAASFPTHRNVTSPGKTTLFAESSGTSTGNTKYIPVTRELLASNRKAAIDLLVFHSINRPESRLLAGKGFFMGATTELTRLAPGVSSGKMSGISMKTRNLWTHPFAWPPNEIASLQDWSEKITLFTDRCFREPITVWGGLPNWMIVLLEHMRQVSNGRQPFPHLQLLVHSGMAWDIYDTRFKDLLTETGATRLEIYTASEGFIATEDRGPGNGMLLNLSGNIFYEFIPLRELGEQHPTRHWVGDIEVDQEYAVVLTTCAGLYAYLLGDTVRFVDRDPPRLYVTGRTDQMMSVFGEHLLGDEIDRAVQASAAEQSVTILEYAVGPVLLDGNEGRGRHVYLISTADAPDTVRLAKSIDTALIRLNNDYAIHRRGRFGLLEPEVRLVGPGVFLQWMTDQGKVGDQYKIPRVITDQTKFSAMLEDFTNLNDL